MERLPQVELKRRIAAGRQLRGGWSQPDLSFVLHELGLKKHDAKGLESGRVPLQEVQLNALMDALTLPRAWFTEPLAEVFQPAEHRLARIEATLNALTKPPERPGSKENAPVHKETV